MDRKALSDQQCRDMWANEASLDLVLYLRKFFKEEPNMRGRAVDVTTFTHPDGTPDNAAARAFAETLRARHEHIIHHGGIQVHQASNEVRISFVERDMRMYMCVLIEDYNNTHPVKFDPSA
jgi:hypothetical protein